MISIFKDLFAFLPMYLASALYFHYFCNLQSDTSFGNFNWVLLLRLNYALAAQ